MRIIIYPVEKEHRQTIFRKYASSTGGGIKKLNRMKKDEEIKTYKIIITTGKVINSDGIVTYEHFLDNKLIDDLGEIEVEGTRRLVFTEKGSVHRLFYSETEKGNI